MAKKISNSQKLGSGEQHLVTSIGNSVNTRPKNKHSRKNFKKYRGQGK